MEVHESTALAGDRLAALDRVLLLGTEIGVKGRQLHPDTPRRVAELAGSRGQDVLRPVVIVDGGIRRHTVPILAAAGADGVIPGSLVYGEADPRAAVTAIRALVPGQPLQPGQPLPPDQDFWRPEVSA